MIVFSLHVGQAFSQMGIQESYGQSLIEKNHLFFIFCLVNFSCLVNRALEIKVSICYRRFCCAFGEHVGGTSIEGKKAVVFKPDLFLLLEAV